MNKPVYHAIDELTVRDAVKHLEDARRMGAPAMEANARTQLRELLEIVENHNPELYQQYLKHLD